MLGRLLVAEAACNEPGTKDAAIPDPAVRRKSRRVQLFFTIFVISCLHIIAFQSHRTKQTITCSKQNFKSSQAEVCRTSAFSGIAISGSQEQGTSWNGWSYTMKTEPRLSLIFGVQIRTRE
jgi:hypothetical protein